VQLAIRYSGRMKWSRVLWAALLAGCPGNDPPPKCITVDTTCAPGYVPTFDNVYKNTISPSCAQSASCHAASGHMGGLDMSDEATAYSNLMMQAHIDPSRARVTPGDPACSLMIVRTDSPGASYQMPPGDPLSALERCALVHWVACGAPGPGMPCQ
jgi:hypothetical protein